MSAGYKSNFQQGLPWLGYNIFVQKFHSALKTSELHHGVWNLPHPQRGEAFVKANEKKIQHCKNTVCNNLQHYY